MKKFLSTIFAASLFVTATGNAEVKTYEGTDEYFVLGTAEDINVARERAREKAIRNAREKAGVYVHSYSRTTDFELVEDEVISVASGILRIIEVHYETVKLTNKKDYLIRATVKADIDTGDLEKFLEKDAEEISQIAARDAAVRQQETLQEERIEELKTQYEQAETVEEQEVIVQQIAVEDKIFLSNLKLREGNRCRDAGDYKRAAEFFTEAIELNPDNVMAWNGRAWTYAERKQYKQAIADFDKAIDLDSNSELSYFGRGWVHYRLREYAAAIKEYNKVIEINPNNSRAWNDRGAAKSWLGNMTAAVDDYSRAIELKPNYARAYENRSKAYASLGDEEKSAADRQRADKFNRSNKGADKLIDEALTLRKHGDFDGALKILNEAAEKFPDNQYVYVNRGNIYNDDLKNYAAAIADFDKTIELNANFSWPYHNRALAYERQNKNTQAVVDYGKAIDLDPNYASAYNGRAWNYFQLGNFDAALVDVDKALKLKPDEANYYDTRACVFMGLKRYDEAIADLERAIKLSPEAWIYRRLGEVYKLTGDEAKAQAEFDKARELGYKD